MSRTDPRKVFLTLLLGAVFITAHPLGLPKSLNLFLWSCLNKVGLDISMTPLTFDMMMMYDSGKKLNIYKYKIDVIYRSESGDKIIPGRALSFYGFKVPAILFSEMCRAGIDTSCFIYAMSYYLKKQYGPGTEFMIHVNTDEEGVKSYGLNIFYPCF